MPYMEFRIDNTLISNYSSSSGGSTDTFVFQPEAASTPSVSEVVVTKVNDIASEPLFRNDTDINGFIIDGSNEGHTGGANSVMYDSSVRSYNPYITVDYVEVI